VKVAFLFPGQGSQVVGMGADLVAHVPVSKGIFDEASLQLGYKLDSLCFYGPPEKLSQTDITQPALFTVSIAALKALEEAGIHADASAGHSVGEYAALFAARVFDFPTGLRLVNQRGLAMSRMAASHPGAMAAVLGLTGEEMSSICSEATQQTGATVVPANFNGGGQVVISGESVAVELAAGLAKDRGAKRAIMLQVSGAFHSPLMKPAAQEMKVYLDGTVFRNAVLPVVANVTADFESEAEEIKTNLSAQIDGPVRWEESITRLLNDDYDAFIEIGSGTVLTGLMKRIASDARAYNVSDPAGVANVVSALRS
jgi:[acyl-carrier-protein] S-malonyltransferase